MHSRQISLSIASQTQSQHSLVKELSRVSRQQCSSAQCQSFTPAAPMALAFPPAAFPGVQVPQAPCTRAPWSCAVEWQLFFHHWPCLGKYSICYIHGKFRVAGKCMYGRYFCCAFKLLRFESWLNLADFSEKLTRRICSVPSACPAAGTIASRQPHKAFKITQQFLLWPSVHGIRLKCF